jgi:hypothetical protein
LLWDIGSIAAAVGACAVAGRILIPWPASRSSGALVIGALEFALLAVAGASSSLVRGLIADRWRLQAVKTAT